MLTACFQVASWLRRPAEFLARHGAHVRRSWVAAVLCAALLVPLTAPRAQQGPAIIRPGDAAVTGFSGAKVWGEVPSDVHPIDRTFIDTSGAVLQVFDLSKLGGPPSGQVANAPAIYRAIAGDVGQVFGITLDSDTANKTPSIYVAATSLFGLQIVSAAGERLVKGEPGARWMPGQFGAGGGPGSIWKIDGTTGTVSLFANLKRDGKDNAGPALGALAYDPDTDQLFAADLEFGLIHRLGRDGHDRGTFDHGVAGRQAADLDPIAYDASARANIETPEFDIEDPFTWGFADARRLVFALAVANKRLYYSVEKPLHVWSIGINADGSFADDPRLEIEVTGSPSANLVTDIAFDGPDRLYLSQRSEVAGSYDYSVFAKLQTPVVRRYSWSESDKRWSEDADEFAIGLKTPHRSTDGGIALSYGYDVSGNIDYGQCRETLWTTGGHLREGEDKDRVAKGGAPTVHGLQGNKKSDIRPDNVPPYETWFVDDPGFFDDANVYGRIGSIAIYAPCDSKIAEVPETPVTPVPYPVPTPVEGGIWIKKECLPAPFGGLIHCLITVTNSGDTILDGPVSFFDAATILAGPGAGGAVIIVAAAPDVPQWVCSPTPAPDLSCSLPPELLPPGASHVVDVTIDTGPLVAAGDHGFHNCASLQWPAHGVACADGGTSLVIIKTAPAACAPGADCTFGVTITNTGGQPFSGDVVLSDAAFMGAGAAMPAPITAIVPPLGCVPAPGAVPFSCVAPLTLAPGESKPFAITVTMPPGLPPGYWAHNCISISAPGVPPPALPPPSGSIDNAVSCAWVPVGAPLPLSNLRIVKTALNAAKCNKAPGGIILCDYEIVLINDGPSPFHDAITVNDTVPAAATLTVLSPAWACAGGPPIYACSSNPPGPVDIPVGGALAIPVEISIPLAPLEAAGCALPNTAAIAAPAAGAGDNYDGADDSSTATADAFLTWVDGVGVTHVTCDPSNLKTTKTSKGDCVPAGASFRCEFIVTVENMGPDPYHGPLKLGEQLSPNPQSVTFSAPWGCVGGGASYQCFNPHVDLNKGDTVELAVTVIVPAGKQCALTNKAATIFPAAGTRFNNKTGDDAAAATAKIPSPRCERPDRPRCTPKDNELRTEIGACVCKAGFLRDRKHVCISIFEPPRCPDGSPVPKNGRCPQVSPVCEPGPHEYRNDDGECVCRRGYVRNDAGRCVERRPECEPGPHEYRNDDGECVCRRGYVRNDAGRCVERHPECEPGPNEYRNEEGECVCKRGYIRDDKGRCVEKRPECDPGPNEYRDDEGKCVCKRGYIRDENKRCVKPTDPGEDCRKKGWTWTGSKCVEPKCEPGPNEYRNNEGQCVCQRGYERDDKGRCVKTSDPAEDCRKKGWTWDGKTCLPPSDPAADCKKKGWIWNGEVCVEPSDPAADCKKKGWTWTGNKCVEPANPAADCRKKGWTWTGNKCVEPSNPAADCRKKGWTWTGSKCIEPSNPAVDCRKKGWTWTGSKCIEPPKKIEPKKEIEIPKKIEIPKIIELPKTIIVPKTIVVPKACPPGTKGVYPNCTKG